MQNTRESSHSPCSPPLTLITSLAPTRLACFARITRLARFARLNLLARFARLVCLTHFARFARPHLLCSLCSPPLTLLAPTLLAHPNSLCLVRSHSLTFITLLASTHFARLVCLTHLARFSRPYSLCSLPFSLLTSLAPTRPSQRREGATLPPF